MYVCVCVFGIIVLKIVVERWFWESKMLFGSLVELHAWLHSYLCFSLLEKLFLSNLDSFSTPPRHLAFLLRSSADFLSQSRHLSTTRWIDRELSYLLDSFLTPLDRSRTSCMHCFSHVLHLSFLLSSIASCFFTFMHFYGFFVPLRWSFLASCILCQSWQKGGEIVETQGEKYMPL